jgi:16S rRNA U1498 N3-methylase RsmE
MQSETKQGFNFLDSRIRRIANYIDTSTDNLKNRISENVLHINLCILVYNASTSRPLVEKCVELRATRVIPLAQKRSGM